MPRSCIALALLCSILAARAAAEPDPRWNVLLLVAEDLGPRIGAYGDALAHTPTIDRLAERGTRFSRAFTTSGVCAPSRAAIVMGVHQNHFGAGHMRAAAGGYVAAPPGEWKAFPELLRAAGYHVVNNGKTDYQMSTRLGGVYGGPESIWDDENTEDWRERRDGQPFFAYLTYLGTHESQVWPTWDFTSLPKLLMGFLRVPNHLRWPRETDPARVAVPPYYPDTPTVRADLARHYNNVAGLDAWVADVLRKLRDDGLADRTVVIFTSDHGDGLPRAKRWLYDSGIHVPLIVVWPGVTSAGSVNAELVSGVDLAPTILSAAGLPIPEHMEGRVFLGPEAAPEPPYVFAARDRIDESPDRVRAVRDRRFKYVRHLLPDQPYVLPSDFRNQMPMMRELLALDEAGALEGAPALWLRDRRDAEELFDTEADPHEIRNLAGDPAYAATLDRLRTALDAWLASGRDLGLLPEAEIAERFWPGGEQPETPPPRFERRGDGWHLSSATEGASLLWRTKSEKRWTPYVAPVAAEAIEARAVRYGWAASRVVSAP